MASFTHLQLALVLALAVVVSGAGLDRHVVPCGAQQGVCECRETADECEFTLLIEELQTFISYELEAENTGFLSLENADLRSVWSREEEGKPFYINATGALVPSFVFRDDDDDSDCITYNEDFEGAQCTVPITVDGMTYRPCIAVNGQVPGPTLIVYENQTIVANVMNGLLSETIAIHWHGMNQRNTPWMDGGLHVTQCPIAPTESFQYYFKADPTGTFWYHSHRVTQRADGLFGALIVREKAETITRLQNALNIPTIIDRPATQTISLHEWDQVTNLDRYTLARGGIPPFPGKPLGAIPLPVTEQSTYGPTHGRFGPDGLRVGHLPFFSGLINGKGRNRAVPMERSRLEIFTVESGGVYRFRLIGAQSILAYKFSIDEHVLTVISTDGSLVEPVDTHFIIIHTGERYDFLLRAMRPRQGVNDYWIRAETLGVDLSQPLPHPSLGNMAEGILHYGPSPPPSSVDYERIKSNSRPFDVNRCGSIQGGCIAVNCPFPSFHSSYNIPMCINAHQLRLLWPTPPGELPSADVDPDCDDCELFFNVDSDTDSINGRNMLSPPFPLLTQQESIPATDFCDPNTPCDGDDEECVCIHVREISSFNKTIRFVLSSVGREVAMGKGRAHPMHLHGHHFHVVDISYGAYFPENQTLRSRNVDIDCGDERCSSPSWNGGRPPRDYTIDPKTVRKDTVIVPGGGYVVIQFRSDNPGFWFLHCHIIHDLLEGMAVAINEVESRHNPAPPGFPTCGGFTITPDQFYQSLAFDPGVKNSGSQNWLSGVTFLGIVLAIALLLPT